MKIYFATDHAGYELKEKLKQYVSGLGYEIHDFGAHEYDSEDDYPDFIKPCAEAVAKDTASLGIILGGSGQGEAMCANHVQGIRAGVYVGGDIEIVKLLREHNDANILSVGARFVAEDEAEKAVQVFLETPFSNDPRHARRLAKF
jgi:ribose 5-phosphate isomerase B